MSKDMYQTMLAHRLVPMHHPTSSKLYPSGVPGDGRDVFVGYGWYSAPALQCGTDGVRTLMRDDFHMHNVVLCPTVTGFVKMVVYDKNNGYTEMMLHEVYTPYGKVNNLNNNDTTTPSVCKAFNIVGHNASGAVSETNSTAAQKFVRVRDKIHKIQNDYLEEEKVLNLVQFHAPKMVEYRQMSSPWFDSVSMQTLVAPPPPEDGNANGVIVNVREAFAFIDGEYVLQPPGTDITFNCPQSVWGLRGELESVSKGGKLQVTHPTHPELN